ncbi:MAG: metallophosphoesterase [Alphaproteobacteria bacterium]|nr:metallophosphoesterase [Alphaproteobacteria bacterium]
MQFAIGDIHGHDTKLFDLMGHCRAYAEARAARARFILLGDYVDRGPASASVIAFIAGRPADVEAISGNHEALLLEACEDSERLALWIANGGLQTMMSYGVNHPSELPREHLVALRRLPLFVDDGLRLFVHAGIDLRAPDARDPQTLLWTRAQPPDGMVLPRFLVHGHTPTRSGLPDLRPNRLNLDTGAGFGRALTAAGFDGDEPLPRCFIDSAGTVTPVPVRHSGQG